MIAAHRRMSGGAVFAVAALIALVPGAASASTGQKSPGPPKPGDVKQPAYFVMQAGQGTLANGTLMLTGVDTNAALFTDGPEKPAGDLPVSDLLDNWTQVGFAVTPPNAVLAVVDGAGASTASSFLLSNPQRSGASVTFTVQPVPVKTDSHVAASVKAAAASESQAVPPSFGRASLFVDPVNDFMHYCSAVIHNDTNHNLVSAGVLLISPKYFPVGVLKAKDTTIGASLGPLVCNINYGFTGGGYRIGFTMANPIGADNTIHCDGAPGLCVVRVTHDTATFNVDITLKQG
jgi:hypothetical protein